MPRRLLSVPSPDDSPTPPATRPTGWHRRPGVARPMVQTYTHLPSGTPVTLQPDIDAQLQYWCDLYGAKPLDFGLEMFEDVAMGDPCSPDIASLQHRWVWRCAGFDGRALGS